MSAREDLIRSVYSLKNMSQNDMEKLVDAYAHELAEELRGFGMEDAGDFIDPEVE